VNKKPKNKLFFFQRQTPLRQVQSTENKLNKYQHCKS